jgi:hypothetical protein
MPQPGRNEPCPCGSGKKFKQCCLIRTQAATGITPRDRTDAMEALLKFSRHERFDPIVSASARDWADMPLASTGEALQSIMEFETSAQAFFDWLFYDVPGDDGKTIADAFLQTREWTVSGRAADYLRTMRPTHLGLYQIRRIERGRGFELRDVWTRKDLFVTERLGSTQLVKWDLLAARVSSHADGTHQLEGSIMALPPLAAKPLLKELKAEFKWFSRSHPDAPVASFFKDAAPLLHDAWMDHVALREPPTLVTNEGDPMTESTVVFDVPKAGDALVSLLRQPDFEAGTIGRATWIEVTGKRTRVLGDVECNKGTLTLTTFSQARATRGRQRLEEILGPLVLRSETHHAFDARQLGDLVPATTTTDDDDLNDLPEVQALWHELDRAWLDTEVPALDHRTPREAARNKRLRPRLRELLMHLENQSARLNTTARDITWMWKALGLRRP